MFARVKLGTVRFLDVLKSILYWLVKSAYFVLNNLRNVDQSNLANRNKITINTYVYSAREVFAVNQYSMYVVFRSRFLRSFTTEEWIDRELAQEDETSTRGTDQPLTCKQNKIWANQMSLRISCSIPP